MQAVYELSTVKPYLPARGTFTVVEFEVYAKGYYRALVQALRVMKPAAERWEARMTREQRPYVFDRDTGTVKPNTAAAGVTDHRGRFWIRFLSVAAVVGILELLVLLAALIARALR